MYEEQDTEPAQQCKRHCAQECVGKIKSSNSNSNLKLNLDRTCFENSNLKMYSHKDENTNCVIAKQTHIDHNF